MEIQFLPPLPSNAGIITAITPDNPPTLGLGNTPASLLAPYAQAGAVVRGVVQQRLPQGMTLLRTELGTLTIKTEFPLKRGMELAIKIEQVKDSLIAKIIAIDGKSFAKYQEMLGQAPALPQDEINQSSVLTNTVAQSSTLPKMATLPPIHSASALLEAPDIALLAAGESTTPLLATTVRGVLLQPPTLSADIVRQLPPALQQSLSQAHAGTALQLKIIAIDLPEPPQNIAAPSLSPLTTATPSAALPPAPAPLASPSLGSPNAQAPAAIVPTPIAPLPSVATPPPVSLATAPPLASVTPTIPTIPASLSLTPSASSPITPTLPPTQPLPAPTQATTPLPPSAPLPNITSPRFTAQILQQSNPRELTLQSDFGMMKLFVTTPLPKGAVLHYELVQIEQVRGSLTPAIDALAIPARLYGLESITDLKHVYPHAVPPAHQGHIVPRLGATLASDMLFLLTAMQGGSLAQWLGEELHQQLTMRDETGNFMSALSQDFASLRQLPSNVQDNQWHHVLVPLYAEEAVRPIQLFFKKQKGNPRQKQPAIDHFLLEIELTRLGVMQCDGLVQKHPRHTQFDLNIRTSQPWDATLQQEIARIFYDAQATTGMVGSVHFYTGRDQLLTYPTHDPNSSLDSYDNSLLV